MAEGIEGQGMIDQEFARLTNLPRGSMSKKELFAWRDEFNRRNLIDAENIKRCWLSLTDVQRNRINKEAAPIVAKGFAKAQQLKHSK